MAPLGLPPPRVDTDEDLMQKQVSESSPTPFIVRQETRWFRGRVLGVEVDGVCSKAGSLDDIGGAG
jgi:hypothetical protein